MITKLTRYTMDTLPPLTAEQRSELRELTARPDDEIDTSDAPEMTDEQWKSAKLTRDWFPGASAKPL